jgi:predicted RND superfamily exporter protein
MLDSREGFTEPANLALLGAVEDALSGAPHVGAVHSAFNEIVRATAALKNRDYHSFRKALRQGEAVLTREEIEQALSFMSSTRRPQIHLFESIFNSARVTVFVRSASYERIDSVLRAAESVGFRSADRGIELRPFGDGWISYLTVQLLVRGQVYSIALALLTDLLLLWVLFRSFRLAITALLPVAFGVLVVFAVLAATGTPLGIANSMFAGIAIGIGLDFSIHLTTAYQQGRLRGLGSRRATLRAVVSTGPAIITSAVAIASGFLVLALSEVTPNLQLGLMICLSLVTCAAATLVLVPGLVLLRFVTGDKPQVGLINESSRMNSQSEP